MTKQTKPRRRSVQMEAPPGLQISVGWQYNGGVYQLDPWHKEEIQHSFPDARVIGDGLLLGYNKTRDYEQFHKPYFEQIAQMLTGLTPEQIGQMGGIRIFDPVAKKVLWDWRPQEATE